MLFKCLRWVLLAAALVPPVHAQALVATEGALQAALLVNFAAYTYWPALPAGVLGSEKIAFCVMAGTEVAEALALRQNRPLNGKSIDVKTITSAAQVVSCQVVFVGAQAHAKINEVNQLVGTKPILVVAEENGFDQKDVIISLRLQEGRYTFKINQTEALARSLSMSSKLLKLATQVY